MQEKLVDLATLPRYGIPGDEPDPRGWMVVSCDGMEIGTVDTLLVDLDALKARYFVCALKARAARSALPVVYARLDAGNKRVIYDLTPASAFAALPQFDAVLSEADEKVIHAIVVGEVIEPPPPAPSADRRQQPRRDPE